MEIHPHRLNKLVRVDERIPHMRRLVRFCDNPKTIIRVVFDRPITMNGVLNTFMSSNRPTDLSNFVASTQKKNT